MEAGEIDKGGECNPRVERRNKTNWGAQEERKQQRKTMDKDTLCYCTLNL